MMWKISELCLLKDAEVVAGILIFIKYAAEPPRTWQE
jgi:hypothetical protein